jgi:formamidopyrimidine-DNA glycosylase
MHFGMTGWIKFSNDDTAHYRPNSSAKPDAADWPPRFLKFLLHLEGEPPCEVAFVDARRLGRVRLVDAPADDMRKTSPLKDNGPDPVIDKDILTRAWLRTLMKRKKVPVKALLLDQANISGVGNWVADEVLFQARVHPEQYCNTFSDEQIDTLHDKLVEVCTTACNLLAESDKFPEDWLMKHRWDKGKKGANKLPTGENIVHLTVGGRTSAVVPSLQKKTGAVAREAIVEEQKEEGKPKKGRGGARKNGDVNGTKKYEEAAEEEDQDSEPKPARKSKFKEELSDEEAQAEMTVPARGSKRKGVAQNGAQTEADEIPSTGRKRKTAAANTESKPEEASKPSKKLKRQPEVENLKAEAEGATPGGRRRSGRLSKG